MLTRKRITVSFQGDDEVLEHIIPLKERKLGRKAPSRKSRAEEDWEDAEKENVVETEQEEEQEIFRQSTALCDEQALAGADLYGFKTPKKAGQMAKKATQSVQAVTPKSAPSTPKSAVKNRRQKQLAEETGSTPAGKRAARRKQRLAANTPHRLRARNKPAQDSSSSEDSAEDESDDESTTSAPALEDDTVKASQIEDYFSAAGGDNKTSDRTLARLGGRGLEAGQVEAALAEVQPAPYRGLVLGRREAIARERFPGWMYNMCSGYNILLHGLGSKQSLMQEFIDAYLADYTLVVINGYFPSLTIKSILNHITEDVMEHKGSFRNPLDQVDFIRQHYSKTAEEELYLVVHNIDGPMLRNERAQSALSLLATAPSIHILASIDHINAPLVWDAEKAARFCWRWEDVTTLAHYSVETRYEGSLLVGGAGGGVGGGALALSSLVHVLRSLTPNARGVFALIARYQMAHDDDPNYTGMAFASVYQECRAAFLVPSEPALRAQLTEFLDHRLLRSKRAHDGSDSLVVPLDGETLKEYMETVHVDGE